MKVFLDDERSPPEGWVLARWPEDVIHLLSTGEVTDLSLDHDLGDDARGTGHDVIRWVEEAVATRGFVPPRIFVHSANPSAQLRMSLGIASIERLRRACDRSELRGGDPARREPPRLPERWVPLTPAVAAGLEAELHRELGPTHPLRGRELCAVARREGDDDVLFGSAGGDGPVFCVHLTWAVERDPEWPWTVEYRDMADFLERWPREEAEELG